MRAYVVVLALVIFALGIVVGVSACTPANGATSVSSSPVEVGGYYDTGSVHGEVISIRDDGWVLLERPFYQIWWYPTTGAVFSEESSPYE